jgi:hypothetical protein
MIHWKECVCRNIVCVEKSNVMAVVLYNLKHQANTQIVASKVSSLLQLHFQMYNEDKLEAL